MAQDDFPRQQRRVRGLNEVSDGSRRRGIGGESDVRISGKVAKRTAGLQFDALNGSTCGSILLLRWPMASFAVDLHASGQHQVEHLKRIILLVNNYGPATRGQHCEFLMLHRNPSPVCQINRKWAKRLRVENVPKFLRCHIGRVSTSLLLRKHGPLPSNDQSRHRRWRRAHALE
jgi:hypothetical protein